MDLKAWQRRSPRLRREKSWRLSCTTTGIWRGHLRLEYRETFHDDWRAVAREERALQTMPRVLRVVLSRKILVRSWWWRGSRRVGLVWCQGFWAWNSSARGRWCSAGSWAAKVKLKGGQPDFDFVRVENVRARMGCVRRKNKGTEVPLRPESTKMRERAVKM